MANTPVYGWETPDDTDYVYQGAAAARTTANAIDSTLAAQLSATGYGWKTVVINNSSLSVASATETVFFTGGTFTPVANRLYLITYSVGTLTKTTNAGTVFVGLRKNNTSGTMLDRGYMTNFAVGEESYFSKTIVLTSTQMGTSTFTPAITIQASTAGVFGENIGGSYGNGLFSAIDIGGY